MEGGGYRKRKRSPEPEPNWKVGGYSNSVLEVTRARLPSELDEIDTTDLHTNTKIAINTNLKVAEMLQTMKKMFGHSEASARLTSTAVLMAHEEVLVDMAQTFALRNLES